MKKENKVDEKGWGWDWKFFTPRFTDCHFLLHSFPSFLFLPFCLLFCFLSPPFFLSPSFSSPVSWKKKEVKNLPKKLDKNEIERKLQKITRKRKKKSERRRKKEGKRKRKKNNRREKERKDIFESSVIVIWIRTEECTNRGREESSFSAFSSLSLSFIFSPSWEREWERINRKETFSFFHSLNEWKN